MENDSSLLNEQDYQTIHNVSIQGLNAYNRLQLNYKRN